MVGGAVREAVMVGCAPMHRGHGWACDRWGVAADQRRF